MKDLGLLMSDEMALACREGRKTVTRRPMSPVNPWKPATDGSPAYVPALLDTGEWGWLYDGCTYGMIGFARIPGAGIAEIGKRVWIRETFWQARNKGHIDESGEFVPGPWRQVARYRGDALPEMVYAYWIKRPSIHMSKWAARTWGQLTSVRPCDLSGLDDEEARREGFDTAEKLRAALRDLYPGVRWFWRLEWEPIDPPTVAR